MTSYNTIDYAQLPASTISRWSIRSALSKTSCRLLGVNWGSAPSDWGRRWWETLREIGNWSTEGAPKYRTLNIEDLGIMLTGAGVSAGLRLNSIRGIRAALTHNNYIASMCRKVHRVGYVSTTMQISWWYPPTAWDCNLLSQWSTATSVQDSMGRYATKSDWKSCENC